MPKLKAIEVLNFIFDTMEGNTFSLYHCRLWYLVSVSRVSALRQRFVTARLLQTQPQGADEIQLLTDTIHRRLHEHNLTPKIPNRGPALTPQHCRGRFDFARVHIDWLEEAWETFLWLNESKFRFYNSDRRMGVYWRPKERYEYAQCNLLNMTAYGRG